MTLSAQRFAELLQEGINAIAERTFRPKGVVRDELGYAIGRKGGSAIEYWAYGDGRIPKKQAEVAALARAIVDTGQLEQSWLVAFLESAGYPDGDELVAELFPDAQDEPPHNLPLDPTPFVGRSTELAALADLIANPDCRLITLVGPGGSGKTRLAIEAAKRGLGGFADGATFVPLAPIASNELFASSVAGALGLTLDGCAKPQTQVVRYLRGQSMLLVLDNLEHLLMPDSQPDENSALFVMGDILQQAPDVTLLVTSRERLNLQSEWVYDVGGLETPAEESDATAENGTKAYSALTFFEQTARRVKSSFEPTSAEQVAIVRICQLVQGMPLAIELAASWVRMLSCEEISQEIEKGLDFLTTTLREIPPRHYSMQAVFDHSWSLLSAKEQDVFARCSVFRGGFTRDSAVEVAGASLPMLVSLVNKSLLSRDRQGRFGIHELARQYAADRLVDSEQEAQTRDRHAEFFMTLSEEAEPRLRSGPQIVQWYDRIELEHDNLRTALDWAFTDGDFEMGFRMVGALWEFWMNRGHADEGYLQTERFLARPEAAAPTHTHAKALFTAGALAFFQGHYQEAVSTSTEGISISRTLGADGKCCLAISIQTLGYASVLINDFDAVEVLSRECLALGTELQDAWIRGHALLQLAYVARASGDDTLAQQRFQKSFESFQEDGQSVMRAIPVARLGELLYEQGDYAGSHTYFQQSLKIVEDLGDPTRVAHICRCLSRLAMAQGNLTKAEEWLAKALGLAVKTGQIRSRANTLDLMGRLAQQQGDYALAWALHHEGLTIWAEVDKGIMCMRSIEGFACLAARQGHLERAALLFSAAEAFIRANPGQWQLNIILRDPHLRAEHNYLVAIAREELGKGVFAAAWAKGTEMTLEEAVDLALS